MGVLHLFLFVFFTSHLIISSLIDNFGISETVTRQDSVCDIERDTGLFEDPSGNTESYLRCKSIGFGTLGMWKLESCLPSQTFRFKEQKCRDTKLFLPSKNNIFSILNNTCAHGEECIGGTVCDLKTLRCLCPAGTIPDLNTLSCIQLVDHALAEFIHSAKKSTLDNSIQPAFLNVQRAPGSSCANGEVCGGGSFCALPMKICLCPGDMEDTEGRCQQPQRPIATAGAGASCSSAVHCVNGSVCIDGRCQCPDPMVLQGNQCIMKTTTVEVGPGELCDKNQVCSRGSVCHPTIPVCICPANTILQGESCLPVTEGESSQEANSGPPLQVQSVTMELNKSTATSGEFPEAPALQIKLGGTGQVTVGKECRANTDCIIGAFCKANINPSTCQCLSTHVNVNGRCEKVIYPGRRGCRYDAQCSVSYPDAKCFAGECICPDGFAATEQTCKSVKHWDRREQKLLDSNRSLMKRRNFGDSNSSCNNPNCLCLLGFIEKNGLCIKNWNIVYRPVHSHCESRDQCIGGSVCRNSTCTCTAGSQEQFGYCRQKPGGNCADGQFCVGSSFCNLGFCQCFPGYYLSTMNDICVPFVAKPGESCRAGEQCSGGSICRHGLCACTAGYRMEYHQCVKWKEAKTVGGAKSSSEITRKFSERENGKYGLNARSSKRIKRFSGIEYPYYMVRNAAPGQSCGRATRCTGGSACFANVCTCFLNMRFVAGKCVAVDDRGLASEIAPGKSIESEIASETSENTSKFQNKTSNPRGKWIEEYPNIFLCHSNAHCPLWTQCKRGVCRCKTNETNTGDKCKPVAHVALPGQHCDGHRECVGESRCMYGICVCTGGLFNTGLECSLLADDKPQSFLGKALLGQSCLEGQICLNGSKCIHNVCSCSGNEFIDEDGNCQSLYKSGGTAGSWYSKSTLGIFQPMSSKKSETSVSSRTIFRSSNSDLFLKNNSRLKSLDSGNRSRKYSGLPGEECTLGGICWNGAYCDQNQVCSCQQGYLIIDSFCKPAKVATGEFCESNEQCPAGSHCENSVCLCSVGFTDQSKMCGKSELSMPDEGCTRRKYCNNNAICLHESGFCFCPRGERLTNGICQPNVLMDYALNCNRDKDCHDQAACINGYCICLDASIEETTFCVPQHQISAEIEDVQAVAEEEIVLPRRRVIQLLGSKNLEGDKNSRKKNYQDWAHLNTLPAKIYNIQETSKLTIGSTPRISPFFEPILKSAISCTEDQQCPQQAHCLQKICVCKVGFISVNNSCKALRAPYARCELNDICAYNSHCSDGICICVPGTRLARGRCILGKNVAKLGQSCSQDFPGLMNAEKLQTVARICIDGTSCLNGWCVCDPGTVPNTRIGTCVSKLLSFSANRYRFRRWIKDLTSSCRNSANCITGKQCRAGICVSCKDNWKCSIKKVQTVQTPPGGSCTFDGDCKGGSTCQGGWCICPETSMMVIDGICIQMEAHSSNEPSISSTAQTTRSEASHGTTTVSPPNLSNTTPLLSVTLKTPGSMCGPLDICSGGSSCIEGLCICPIGMEFSATTSQCEPKAAALKKHQKEKMATSKSMSIHECERDTQCDQDRICIVHRCKCKSGFIERNESCVQVHETSLVSLQSTTASTFGSSTNSSSFNSSMQYTGNLSLINEIKRTSDTGIDAVALTTVVTTVNATEATAMLFHTSKRLPGQPRITGPPLRKSRTKAITKITYKTRPGIGICPIGNYVVRDAATDYLIVCNGEKPICPPMSYCYVTGYADQEYNCCRFPCKYLLRYFDLGQHLLPNRCNWWIRTGIIDIAPPVGGLSAFRRMKIAKYGEACDTVSHVCLQNSACIEGLCKCPNGRKLDSFGVCSTDSELNKRILDSQMTISLHNSSAQQNLITTQPLGTKVYSQPGQSCADEQICLGGSVCDHDQKKCICAAGHRIYRDSCINQARIVGVQSNDNNTLRLSSYQSGKKYFVATECPLPVHPELCQLPNCFCSKNGDQPPGGLSIASTPQFIVLTFDDAVNGKTVPDYYEIFGMGDFKNPNGCPIGATIFVSHEWTNYNSVELLYQQGFEIASNSITHEALTDKSSERWFNEMAGQRHILSRFGNIPEAEIRGMRAPQLAAGYDEQFEMMKMAKFVYDNTLVADPGLDGEPYWPQTLDYRISWSCSDKNCPLSAFPGIWEIPINMFYVPDNNGHAKRSSMIRGAVNLNSSATDVYNILMDNFERAYITNRAPYMLTLNADFLQLNNGKVAVNALKSFLDAVLKRGDVYVVSIWQLIEWMRYPKSLSLISQSQALQCNITRPKTKEVCRVPNKCMYRTRELASPEHQFLTCNPCPPLYPWLNNPSGSINL